MAVYSVKINGQGSQQPPFHCEAADESEALAKFKAHFGIRAIGRDASFEVLAVAEEKLAEVQLTV